MKAKLTAVIYHQGVKGYFLVVWDTQQHLGVQVDSFTTLPLLEPVEVTGANEGVLTQNPEGKK